MKKENTSIRLKKIMKERGLRQVDVIELAKPYCQKYGIKLGKSDISQYCSGKTEPHQDKLYVLGKALNVSEAWLMGFEVSPERMNSDDAEHFKAFASDFNEKRHQRIISMNITDKELSVVEKYRQLDWYARDIVDVVIDKELERCKDDEERTLTLTEDDLKKFPLDKRIKMQKYLEDGELKVARKNKCTTKKS